MDDQKLVIIGGGLAGLSAGCYARANGFAVTIVEHNLALGGVCTAWRRGPYLIDGCIHWLTEDRFAACTKSSGSCRASRCDRSPNSTPTGTRATGGPSRSTRISR